MSVDQALLESVEESGLPVLRFYRWSPATLSLGYFQLWSERLQHAESSECPAVRRSSGGGAILHDNEITYSFCMPGTNCRASRNTEIYQSIHNCIVRVLKYWSVEARAFDPNSDPPAASPKSFLCFERRYAGDLVLVEFKIVGSAQRRSRNALLQHGSVLLNRSSFAPQLPGICDITDCNIDDSELVSSIANSVCEEFNFDAEQQELSLKEKQRAERLSRDRFGSDEWTQKRGRN